MFDWWCVTIAVSFESLLCFRSNLSRRHSSSPATATATSPSFAVLATTTVIITTVIVATITTEANAGLIHPRYHRGRRHYCRRVYRCRRRQHLSLVATPRPLGPRAA